MGKKISDYYKDWDALSHRRGMFSPGEVLAAVQQNGDALQYVNEVIMRTVS